MAKSNEVGKADIFLTAGVGHGYFNRSPGKPTFKAPEKQTMFAPIPAERRDRWQVMRTIIEQWLRPLTDKDAMSSQELDKEERRLGFSLPLALREWYGLALLATDIWSRQDRILGPPFDIHEGVLIFAVENQGIWSMGVPVDQLACPDPPVVAWMNEAWARPSDFGPLNSSLSECALQFLAWVLKWAVRNPRFACYLGNDYSLYGGMGWWKPSTLKAIGQNCTRCGFPTWRLWERDTVFYEKPDLLIEVCHSDHPKESPHLNVSARTTAALAEYEKMVRDTGFRWDSGNWYS